MVALNKFWDWMAYASVAIFTLWIILKMFGIIHSPLIVEFAPFLTMAFYAGWNIQKLNHLTNELKDFKIEVRDNFHKLEERTRKNEQEIIMLKSLINNSNS